MFFVKFGFVVTHLQIHPAVQSKIRKLWRHCSKKEKLIKSLLALLFLSFNSC